MGLHEHGVLWLEPIWQDHGVALSHVHTLGCTGLLVVVNVIQHVQARAFRQCWHHKQTITQLQKYNFVSSLGQQHEMRGKQCISTGTKQGPMVSSCKCASHVRSCNKSEECGTHIHQNRHFQVHK